MALSPRNDNPDTFMREVDDAVRADTAQRFLRNFGRPLAVLIVVGLLAFAGWLYWQSQQESAAGANGRTFSTALEAMAAERPKAASDQVSALARADDPTYRALALMVQGNSAAARGDVATAAARYGAVANDTNIEQGLRHVALLRQVLIQFDTLPPASVIARLRGLVASPGPAFASAAELTALAEMKRGNDRAAGLLFKRIAETPGVSDSLKSRAVQMAGTLGVDAVATPAAPRSPPMPATKTGE